MHKLAQFFFDRRVIFLALVLGMAGIAVAERMLVTLPMAYFITIAVIALCVVLTGRIKTSIYFGLTLIALIAFVSYAKMKWMSIAPNIIDIYYFALNPGTLAFLIDGFLPLVIGAGLLVFAAVGVLVFLGWHEKPKSRSQWIALAVLPLSIGLAMAAQPRVFNGMDDLMRYRYVTAVFTSLKYLVHVGEHVPLLARLSHEPAPEEGATAEKACRSLRSKPDLFVVQAESVVPPEIYYDGEVPTVLQGAFNGPDSTLRPLHVETYAGGTWVTTTGFATGLPISDLGWLTSYSNYILEGKVQKSLVKSLADCGYHTVYFSPLSYSFVNEGRFMESIGFERFVDQHDMGAPSTHETDAFYYKKALAYLEQHRKTDDRPVFMFILTMSAHSPWDYRMMPDQHFAGEPFSPDAETNEYFRRLAISRTDLADFREELELLGKPAVLMEFGDHQPGSTLEYWQKREGPAPLANEESGAYLTAFQVLPIGMELAAPVPSYERLDVQYLGVTLLDLAGIPLNTVYTDLSKMRNLCEGRYKSCRIEGRLAEHYRCRRDSSTCARTQARRDPAETEPPAGTQDEGHQAGRTTSLPEKEMQGRTGNRLARGVPDLDHLTTDDVQLR